MYWLIFVVSFVVSSNVASPLTVSPAMMHVESFGEKAKCEEAAKQATYVAFQSETDRENAQPAGKADLSKKVAGADKALQAATEAKKKADAEAAKVRARIQQSMFFVCVKID